MPSNHPPDEPIPLRPRVRPLRPAPVERLRVSSVRPFQTASTRTGDRSGSRTSGDAGRPPTEPTEPTCGRCGFPLRDDQHGWIDTSEPGRPTVFTPCPECAPAAQARKLQRRLDRAGVGRIPAYAEAWSWETLLALPGVDAAAVQTARRFAREIAEAAIAWTDQERRGLYLYGRIGRGKTAMAICVLKDAMGAGLSVGYVSLAEYFRALRRSISHNDAKLADEYERLRDETDVLVLDDLGVERPTGFVLEQLYGLIESRASQAGKWTIATSNYDLPDLTSLWIESRMVADADRVTCARIAQRVRRHYTLCEVLGENLLRGAGLPAAEDAAGAGGEGDGHGD